MVMVKQIYKKVCTSDEIFDGPSQMEDLAMAIELLTPYLKNCQIDHSIHRITLDMEVARNEDDCGSVDVYWLNWRTLEKDIVHIEPWWKRIIRFIFQIS